MFQVGILLCIVAIGVRSVTGLATISSALPPNRLDFTCGSGGTVAINATGLDPNAFIFATGTRTGLYYWITFEAPCYVADKSIDGARIFEITGCIANREITVYLMKAPSPGHEAGGTTTPYNHDIIGGHGVAAYVLECFTERVNDVSKLVPNIELNRTAGLILSTETKEPEYNVYVDMSIWKNDTRINAATIIVIGDPLLIVIRGPALPKYYVKTCTAYSNGNPGIFRNIFDNGKVTDDMLMTDFDQNFHTLTNLKATCYGLFCVKATLYAFHFPCINDITLECTIETANPFIYRTTREIWMNDLHGPPGRKRRDSSSQMHLLKSTLFVRDQLDSNEFQQISDGNTREISYYLTGAIAVLWSALNSTG